MKKSLKTRWLKALRSGKYRQATGTLQRLTKTGKVKGNCCLGVLCRVAKIEQDKDRQACLTYFDGGEKMLTSGLRHDFGLSYDQTNTLAAMNDGPKYHGYTGNNGTTYPRRSFKTIANWIEKNIPVTE